MNLSGSHLLKASRDHVFGLMLKPEVLRKCIPGCEKLTETTPDHYDILMKVGIGAIKGTFTGKVVLKDKEPPARFAMLINGTGAPGWLKGQAVIELANKDSGTEVHHNAELTVGGLIAGVGSRMIGVVAKQLTEQFFKALAAQVESKASHK